MANFDDDNTSVPMSADGIEALGRLAKKRKYDEPDNRTDKDKPSHGSKEERKTCKDKEVLVENLKSGDHIYFLVKVIDNIMVCKFSVIQ